MSLDYSAALPEVDFPSFLVKKVCQRDEWTKPNNFSP